MTVGLMKGQDNHEGVNKAAKLLTAAAKQGGIDDLALDPCTHAWSGTIATHTSTVTMTEPEPYPEGSGAGGGAGGVGCGGCGG